MASGNDIIRAHPSKEFFIDMLTRDLGLADAILDLVDNAVQSQIAASRLDVTQVYFEKKQCNRQINAHINITLSDTEFRIEDTCGGISIAEARDEVFLFGNPKSSGKAPGLGVYGIGMKRALFKLGRKIIVKSRTATEEFEVPIVVDEWKTKPDDWTLKFAYAGKIRAQMKSKPPGTIVDVQELNQNVSAILSLPTFHSELSKRIASSYAMFLRSGLKIFVNGSPISPSFPDFAESRNSIKTGRKHMKVQGVDVYILTGITPASDHKPEGWYVFCNGRMIMDADKTNLTGWGEGSYPSFHSKFNHFLGMVFFTSSNVSDLPWTTTKRGVQLESLIYQRAIADMRMLARPILNNLAALYPSDTPTLDTPESQLFQKAVAVRAMDVAAKSDRGFLFEAPRAKNDPGEELVNIQYSKKKKDIERVKKAMKKTSLSARKIGEETFDYYVRKECQ